MSTKEANFSELLGEFGVFKIRLNPRKTHILGFYLRRTSKIFKGNAKSSAVSNIIKFFKYIGWRSCSFFEQDKFFGPILRSSMRVVGVKTPRNHKNYDSAIP